MKVNLDVVGRTYTVHFAEQINALVTYPCSYCGSQQGHPAELMITAIINSKGRELPGDAIITVSVLKALVATMMADKVVCDQAACRKNLRRDMNYWYREAGVEDDTEPPAAE